MAPKKFFLLLHVMFYATQLLTTSPNSERPPSKKIKEETEEEIREEIERTHNVYLLYKRKRDPKKIAAVIGYIKGVSGACFDIYYAGSFNLSPIASHWNASTYIREELVHQSLKCNHEGLYPSPANIIAYKNYDKDYVDLTFRYAKTEKEDTETIAYFADWTAYITTLGIFYVFSCTQKQDKN